MTNTYAVEKITSNGPIIINTFASLKMARAYARMVGGHVLPPAGIEAHDWALVGVK